MFDLDHHPYQPRGAFTRSDGVAVDDVEKVMGDNHSRLMPLPAHT